MNKSYKKLKDIAKVKLCFLYPYDNDIIDRQSAEWITHATLQSGNILGNTVIEDKFIKDEELLVRSDDILIRRINPTFVNYIDKVDRELYAYNNLFIIRAEQCVDAKYLACVLNEVIRKGMLKVETSTTLQSISNKMLGELPIPMPSMREQELIGNIWFLSSEKNRLMEKLINLESMKERTVLNNYIFGDNR